MLHAYNIPRMLRDLRADGAGFHFAGFTWPACVWTLPEGKPAARLTDRRRPIVCGPYYHAPRPEDAGSGAGFYLDSDGAPGLRWTWCDETEGARIEHTGWYCDDDGFQTIRGIVLRLPRGRGFLAGWSMGAGMASTIDATIYDSARDAAYAADSMAERAAERERDYQAAELARLDSEESEA